MRQQIFACYKWGPLARNKATFLFTVVGTERSPKLDLILRHKNVELHMSKSFVQKIVVTVVFIQCLLQLPSRNYLERANLFWNWESRSWVGDGLATAASEFISVAEKEFSAVNCFTKRLRLLRTLRHKDSSHAQVLSSRQNVDWWLSQLVDKSSLNHRSR